ncbi:hypothetical protein [Pinibacter soli]|uniref:Uncharacterized protein n=1 Tax=Pinibacter soli TaxID=3044211 RepID=A0ABT6R9Q1_9BACT|nr:hypothetical protein [Pinibacter soli]MDI3319125.1 hypothetical protein [Pinibacter soli]
MALSKDVLGKGLYNALKAFNDKDKDALGDLEDARLSFCKALADEIIKHIASAGVVKVTVNTTGTAAAQAGTGTGTIS